MPIFSVNHSQKKGQICVIFASSAKQEGTTHNDVLLSGPDMNNTVLGVLIHFYKEPIAITADYSMLYCFIVREDHQAFLRFLWFEDSDPDKQIVEYCGKVHVFVRHLLWPYMSCK